MHVSEYYRKVLEGLLGFSVAEDGYTIAPIVDGKHVPLVVGYGNQKVECVLPTPEFLANPSWDGRIAFHPYCESHTRGESDGLKAFRSWVWATLQSKFVELIETMVDIALNEDVHRLLKPSGAEYLTVLGKPRESLRKAVSETLIKVSLKPLERLISITVRQGKKEDDGMRRVAVVHFPLVAAIEKELDGDKVLGTHTGAGNRKAILALLQYIFGAPEDRSAYTCGSRSDTAPYFDAILRAAAALAARYNEIVDGLGDATTLTPIIVPEIPDQLAMRKMASSIPALPGFEGTVTGGEAAAKVASATAAASTGSLADMLLGGRTAAPSQPLYQSSPAVPSTPKAPPGSLAAALGIAPSGRPDQKPGWPSSTEVAPWTGGGRGLNDF